MRERTILLVEDETAIREGLRDALEDEGYRVLEAADGVKGLHHGLTADPDLIVLDLMLPGLDGYQLLERLRADGVETPVLCLTARGLEQDRVKGLALGADDYMVKPFGLQELLARIEARLRVWDRERGLVSKRMLHLGEVTVDFEARRAMRNDHEIPFTPLELKLLAFFAEHEGCALSRTELLAGVWGDEADAVSRVVDNAVMALRKKLTPDHFASVRGIGYRFDRSPTNARENKER
ncbi:MAG: response regulator transcription factor [Planctomycetota bacterium]|jgi:DNA-binding response OmpR family regulator